MKKIEVPIEDLKNLCIPTLMKKGASQDESQVVFEDYLDAEMRGRTSHGFVSFNVALGQFPKAGSFEVRRRTDCVIEIEGNGDCGHTVARKSIDLAMESINRSGVVVIGIRNVTRFSCPGPIARYGATHGKIVLVFEYGGQAFSIPYHGKRPVLSTNPFGIAFPVAEGSMFVLDAASSEKAIGFVSLAKMFGEKIPKSWGVDTEGKPTTDPTALAATKTFGGHKGFGLALAFEVLSGILVGVPVGSKGKLGCRGAFILLIEPTVFGQTTETFTKQLADFLTEVTASEPVGAEAVTYPGQRGEERFQQAMKRGTVEMAAAVYEQLKSQCS